MWNLVELEKRQALNSSSNFNNSMVNNNSHRRIHASSNSKGQDELLEVQGLFRRVFVTCSDNSTDQPRPPRVMLSSF